MRAHACAKILTTLLKAREIKHKTITIHVPRELVDVNRDKPSLDNLQIKTPAKINNLPEAIKAWTQFNQRIATTIMQEKSQSLLFLDIHSFPKGSFNDAQITILDIYQKNRPELQQLAARVKSELGIKIELLKGGKNYIQDHYQTEAYPLLIEFCEDKTYLSQREIKAFFALFLDWIKLSQIIV
jgi:hypothetical protein